MTHLVTYITTLSVLLLGTENRNLRVLTDGRRIKSPNVYLLLFPSICCHSYPAIFLSRIPYRIVVPFVSFTILCNKLSAVVYYVVVPPRRFYMFYLMVVVCHVSVFFFVLCVMSLQCLCSVFVIFISIYVILLRSLSFHSAISFSLLFQFPIPIYYFVSSSRSPLY